MMMMMMMVMMVMMIPSMLLITFQSHRLGSLPSFPNILLDSTCLAVGELVVVMVMVVVVSQTY